MRDTRSPVILFSQIRDALKDGAWIEVECTETAYKAGNTHRGCWKVYVCDKLRETNTIARAMYVVVGDLTPRIFKTAAGIMNLAIELELRAFACPLIKGVTVAWKFEEEQIALDR